LLSEPLPYNYKNEDTSLSAKNASNEISTDRIFQNHVEEKVNSINRRIDDVLIFGGIIVTLLLAINVSVYFRTGHEVEKHFKEHFKDQKKEIDDSVKEIRGLLNQAKTEVDFAEEYRKNITEQKPEING